MNSSGQPVCRWASCGKPFPSLRRFLRHIKGKHIERSVRVIAPVQLGRHYFPSGPPAPTAATVRPSTVRPSTVRPSAVSGQTFGQCNKSLPGQQQGSIQGGLNQPQGSQQIFLLIQGPAVVGSSSSGQTVNIPASACPNSPLKNNFQPHQDFCTQKKIRASGGIWYPQVAKISAPSHSP